MSSNPTSKRNRKKHSQLQKFVLPVLDILALGTWGILMLKYWLKGQLSLLIHPNYFGLVVAAGITLVILSVLRLVQLINQARQQAAGRVPVFPVGQHISLFPPGWSSVLLLVAAILGLVITPQVFASQTAIQRGITDSLTMTRAQPQAFRSYSNSEERSIIDWVRTLSVYPEPDAYQGQSVKVQGFVVYPPHLPSQYILISRFVITCCAADAYPVGLPVKLSGKREDYPVDSWQEVSGQMITETLDGKRQLVIEASSLKKIPKPANPYSY
jgi:uncharacterized repeat protein (TIGR03943 family)